MRKFILHVLIISFVLIAIPITSATGGSITLRSYYRNLSVSEVHSMPNVSMRVRDEYGFSGHSIINHNYNFKTIGGDKVVVDKATGLMWHQNGSDSSMRYKTVKKWIRKLNKRGYAGYQDWRLPTVEEAASLLESRKKNTAVDEIRASMYIDSFFGDESFIWTGDEFDDGSGDAWGVDFRDGSVGTTTGGATVKGGICLHFLHKMDGKCFFVRPVRSVE